MVNIILIILVFALEHSIFPFVPFLPVAPNLLLILVSTNGFVYGEMTGLFYGLLSGILMDLFFDGPFGMFTLVFVWVGYLNGLFSRHYYEDYIFLPVVLCTINEFLYNLFIFICLYFIRGEKNPGFYLRTVILPELVVTVIFMLVLYRPYLALNRALKHWDETKKGAKLVQ